MSAEKCEWERHDAPLGAQPVNEGDVVAKKCQRERHHVPLTMNGTTTGNCCTISRDPHRL
ncbi:hypothetical protein NONI108955_39670 [Nocardia ninae]